MEILANNNLFVTLIKSFYFKQFLGYINVFVNSMLPNSSITIKEDFCWSVIVQCLIIQNVLTTTKSKIHLICDIWIFSNNYIIWGMQAIFFDSKYCKQNFLINLE